MDKNSYLQKRRNNEVDLMSAFEFYINKDSSNNKLDFNQFSQYFPIYVGQGATLSNFWSYMDEKYNVMKLVDQNGYTSYF